MLCELYTMHDIPQLATVPTFCSTLHQQVKFICNLYNVDITNVHTLTINTPIYETLLVKIGSRDSSVGIVTGYGLGGPGVDSQCGQNFPHLFILALRSTQPPIQAAGCVALNTHPHQAPRLKKEENYTCAPPLGLRGLF